MILKIDSDVLNWINLTEHIIRGKDTYYAKLLISMWKEYPRLGYALFKDAEKLYDITKHDIHSAKTTAGIDIKTIPSPPYELVFGKADGFCRVSFIHNVSDYDGYVTKFF